MRPRSVPDYPSNRTANFSKQKSMSCALRCESPARLGGVMTAKPRDTGLRLR